MSRHVAFLRGMNLGARRITNDELGSHFEDLGFGEVETFLASGNVVFAAETSDVSEIERRIEEGLEVALEYQVPTFVRTADEVRAIAAYEPFEPLAIEESTGSLQIALLAAAPEAEARAAVLDLETDDDRLAFGDRELYWLPAAGVSGTDLEWRRVEQIVGTTTVRTVRTIERVVAKFL